MRIGHMAYEHGWIWVERMLFRPRGKAHCSAMREGCRGLLGAERYGQAPGLGDGETSMGQQSGPAPGEGVTA